MSLSRHLSKLPSLVCIRTDVMYVLWLALGFAFAFPQSNDLTPDELMRARQQATLAREQTRQQAIQLNELLGNINSEADAQTIVDSVAKMFERELPPAWATRSVRQRVARAEYDTVTNPPRLIPEQRIADVWNEYIRLMNAPAEALVTTAEIHSLRDGQHAVSLLSWTRDRNRTIWSMPNVAAIGLDGKVANGCRALEALKVIFILDHWFQNVRSARENLKKGIVVSDQIKKELEDLNPRYTTKLITFTNPVRPAEERYVSEHGLGAFNHLLEGVFNQLFPG